MSVSPTEATQYSTAAPVSRKHEAVDYPERHWIAQSVWHGHAVRWATEALYQHFRDREDVLVAMELAVYYLRGNSEVWLQPDVQVVFGVEKGGNRSTYKVWQEGKAPDFVLEVASPSTAEHDAVHSAAEYARIGVQEYWRVDPEGTLMSSALEGYEARAGQFEPVAAAGEGRWLRSLVLGLDLRSERRDGATVVVFRDPLTGEEFDGALEGADGRRRIAERRADAAELRVKALERQLRNELDRTHASEQR